MMTRPLLLFVITSGLQSARDLFFRVDEKQIPRAGISARNDKSEKEIACSERARAV
jgi:hypothetical protein